MSLIPAPSPPYCIILRWYTSTVIPLFCQHHFLGTVEPQRQRGGHIRAVKVNLSLWVSEKDGGDRIKVDGWRLPDIKSSFVQLRYAPCAMRFSG